MFLLKNAMSIIDSERIDQVSSEHNVLRNAFGTEKLSDIRTALKTEEGRLLLEAYRFELKQYNERVFDNKQRETCEKFRNVDDIELLEDAINIIDSPLEEVNSWENKNILKSAFGTEFLSTARIALGSSIGKKLLDARRMELEVYKEKKKEEKRQLLFKSFRDITNMSALSKIMEVIDSDQVAITDPFLYGLFLLEFPGRTVDLEFIREALKTKQGRLLKKVKQMEIERWVRQELQEKYYAIFRYVQNMFRTKSDDLNALQIMQKAVKSKTLNLDWSELAVLKDFFGEKHNILFVHQILRTDACRLLIQSKIAEIKTRQQHVSEKAYSSQFRNVIEKDKQDMYEKVLKKVKGMDSGNAGCIEVLLVLFSAINTDTDEFLKDAIYLNSIKNLFRTQNARLAVNALKTEAISSLVNAKLEEASVASLEETAFDDVVTGDALLANQQKTNIRRLAGYVADFSIQKGVVGIPEESSLPKEKEVFANPIHQIKQNLQIYLDQIIIYLLITDEGSGSELSIERLQKTKIKRILPDSYFCRLSADLTMKLTEEAIILYEQNKDILKYRILRLKQQNKIPIKTDDGINPTNEVLELCSILFEQAYGSNFSDLILYNQFDDYRHKELEDAFKQRHEKRVKPYEKFANDVGTKIAPPSCRYTLFTFGDMYKGKEFKKDKGAFASRFRLLRIGTAKKTGLSTSILGRMTKLGLDPKNVIVQLPSKMADPDVLAKIKEKAPGIKFMVINTQGLKGTKKKSVREEYRRNIYSMMYLARNINHGTRKNSKLYRLLRFLVKEHFPIISDRDIEIDKYMDGLMNNKISQIVNFILSYKPAIKIDEPDVNIVSVAFMSA